MRKGRKMDRPDFTGKIVVITGAGRGLGAAFAVVLADLGAEVIMTGRNTEQVTTMAEAIGQRPDEVWTSEARKALF